MLKKTLILVILLVFILGTLHSFTSKSNKKIAQG